MRSAQPALEYRRPLRVPASVALLVAFAVAGAALGQSPSTTTLSVTAGGAPITTTAAGTIITFTATVTTGGAAVTPGQVEFCDAAPPHCTDIHLLGTTQLSAAGVATLNLFPGAPGNHAYQAVFLGTHSAAPSVSSPFPVAVSSVPSFPTITAITNANFIGYGTYSFSTSVTGAGGLAAPTGTVSILDTSNGNYVLASVPLVPGTGTGPPQAKFSYQIVFPAGYDRYEPDYYSTDNGNALLTDLNSDGKPDLVILEPFNLEALLGNGDGTFSPPSYTPAGTTPLSVAVADFNGDGKPDLAVASYGAYPIPFTPPPNVPPYLPPPALDYPGYLNSLNPGTITILLGNGDGTFQTGTTIPSLPAGASTTAVATGDFNGDGIPDLAVAGLTGTAANPNTGTVYIFLGNGDGTFTQKSTPPVGLHPDSIAVGDLNGDGIQDLAVVNRDSNTLTILLGNGDGTFHSAPTSSWGPLKTPLSVAAADFNSDGILDLAVSSYGTPYTTGDSIEILRGNGDGTFAPWQNIPERFKLNSLAVTDANSDGIPDLVVSEYEGSIEVLAGRGDATFTPFTTINTVSPSSIAVADLNGQGLPDIVTPGTETPSVNVFLETIQAPGANISKATTANFFVVGTGTHQLVASYSGDSTHAPSISPPEGVTAEPEPTTLTFTASPGTIVYGQQITLTAILTPSTAQNHTATGTVTFSSGTTLVGTAPIVNGTATFSTTLLPSGVDALSAAYSGDTNFAAATASATATVNGSVTTTTLTAAPNPATIAQAITLNASVLVVSVTTPPTGSVTFFNGTTALGQAPLNATGHATLTVPGLPAGTYSLTAAYAGNASDDPSTSSPIQLLVANYGSVTTLTAAPNPAGVGQPVTLSTAVTGVGSSTTPTGSVTFYDGALQLSTVPLNATAHAAYTTSTLAIGTHTLTAVYTGDAVYAPGTSSPVTETIGAATFTITLASPSLTLQTHQHTTTSVTLTSLGNFADSITVACPTVPTYITCVFTPTPAALTSNNTATVSFYLDTNSILGGSVNGPLGAITPSPASPMNLALLLFPTSAFLALAARRARRNSLLLLLLAILSLPAALALTACGANQIRPVPSAAPGVYVIPITATGATTGITRTAQLTLTVTP